MIKNQSGQVVQCQIQNFDGTSKTDGTVTVYVLKDGGTRATGSVGSGAATHEGDGLWSYAPSQSETNANTVSFQFVPTSGTDAGIQARHFEPVAAALTASDIAAAVKSAVMQDTAEAAAVETIAALSSVDVDGIDWLEFQRLMAALFFGKSTGHPNNPVYRDLTDSKDRIEGQVDDDGNRTILALDAS